MRTGSKRLLRVGIFAGLAYSLWVAWRRRVPAPGPGQVTWDSAPFPFPPIPRPAPAATPPAAATPAAVPAVDPFTEPASDGTCPISHPVKAKLGSGIYHVPGGGNYERTKADRCYIDSSAAEADGLRAAKR